MNKKEIIEQLEKMKKMLELNQAPNLCFDNNYLRHKVMMNILNALQRNQEAENPIRTKIKHEPLLW